VKDANKEAAATLGFSAAPSAPTAAFSSPRATARRSAITGRPEAALYAFIAFYVTCIAVTWWHYSPQERPHALLNPDDRP
jgi:NNP family nitrate/nitrite transporter-like MFS transporter